nr:hypothetical protein [Tanacetum cinerariifolium]
MSPLPVVPPPLVRRSQSGRFNLPKRHPSHQAVGVQIRCNQLLGVHEKENPSDKDINDELCHILCVDDEVNEGKAKTVDMEKLS